MFDVTNYLKENAFKDEYSLFDDKCTDEMFKNGGLFAKTPEDTPRDVKQFLSDKNSLLDELPVCGDIPEYPYDLDSFRINDSEAMTPEELEWLGKSEDEIRNRIFELAEEIQLESKAMYRQAKTREDPLSSRKSESVSESRNAFDFSSPSSKMLSSSEGNDSSPALSSYVPKRDERMTFLSLDAKPTGKFRRDFSRPTADDGLVDWRVAARTAEQNAQRSENALGGMGMDDRQGPGISAKRRLCRHFLKGFCNRGDTCDFLHDNSIFCPDEQKVFLGGLPTHITADSLCTLLKEMNYTVINKPKILRGFTPQVCLSSISEAQELIRKKKIYLDNTPVDVRPYEDRKPPDDLKRSVFLGGLAADTTVDDIKQDLAKAGFPVENNPILKAGFVPQVVLESVEKAQELIKMAKIRIRNKAADVRPYVNFRKRY